MQYYGTRLSENISRREPEGYLLCLNVPVARTGVQEYLPGELGLTSGSELPPAGGPVQVFRPEDEVFSPQTVASFEGMPVTNDHPPDGVDVSNIRALQKGHAHNIRRGTGSESDLLLADLIITDPYLIRLILEEGKREISCGYTYELCRENGRYIQRKIRGNHVAVVDAGRAGARVSIRDRRPSGFQPGGPRPYTTKLKGAVTMKKSLSKVLARLAKDGDPETVAEIIEEMIEPEAPAEEIPEAAAEAAEESGEAPAVENAENVIAIDEDGLAGILERLDRIISLLEPAAADEDPAAEEIAEAVGEAVGAAKTGDPLAEQVTEAIEEILDPVSSVILEAETDEDEPEDRECLQTGDALRAALTAVRPALACMSAGQRKKVAADITARLRRPARGSSAADAYSALRSAAKRTAPASADLGRRIMEKRNAAYRKQRALQRTV